MILFKQQNYDEFCQLILTSRANICSSVFYDGKMDYQDTNIVDYVQWLTALS